MKFKENIFVNYLQEAPLPLAMERWLECEIYKTKSFAHPILDIGCGEGMYAYILFDEKIDTGIDPNAKELDRAKEYGAYDELINCFGNAIPKPDKSYQTIFSNSVMEHIPQIDNVLKEAYRLLADNGKMYVTVPTDMFDQYSVVYQVISGVGMDGLAKKYRVFFNRFWAHYHFYDKSGWVEVFERNGFKIFESREYASKTLCFANDFLAPFSIISFIVKKISNKWFLFPHLRKIAAKMLNVAFLPFVKKTQHFEGRGGLIFFELGKVS